MKHILSQSSRHKFPWHWVSHSMTTNSHTVHPQYLSSIRLYTLHTPSLKSMNNDDIQPLHTRDIVHLRRISCCWDMNKYHSRGKPKNQHIGNMFWISQKHRNHTQPSNSSCKCRRNQVFGRRKTYTHIAHQRYQYSNRRHRRNRHLWQNKSRSLSANSLRKHRFDPARNQHYRKDRLHLTYPQ